MSQRQTLLPLTLAYEPRLEEFIGAGNAQLVQQLQQCVSQKLSLNALFIHGDAASGKSYLLQASCEQAKRLGRKAYYFHANEAPWRTIDISELADDVLLCVDDIDLIAQDEAAQQQLLHWYEYLLPRAGQLIVSASVNLSELNLSLQDLQSRLSIGGAWQIQALTDSEKQDVLKAVAKQRGIELDDGVVKYLLTHYSRDIGRQIALFNRLDNAALTQKKRLTIPFIKSMIDAQASSKS